MASRARPTGPGKAMPNNAGVAMPTNSHSTGDKDDNVGMAMPTNSPSGGDKNQGQRECRIQIDQKASNVSIFRVPNFLKLSKKGGAYVPKIVLLGPFYHAELQAMKKHKEKAQRRMETRFRIKKFNDSNSTENFLSRAKAVILNLDGEIRKSYEEIIGSKEELAEMLCMDGCFILEILRTLGGDGLRVEGYEPIFERNRIDYTGFDIVNDILKLENQVPLIVLRKLLELVEVNSNDVEGNLFRWLVESPRSKFYPFEYKELQPDQVQEAPHLLGLLHGLIVSSAAYIDQSKPKEVKAVKRIPRAGKLKNAGIKFEASDAGIRKIRFDWETGTIFLPRIYVTDHTEVLFRNLIAFEVCKASDEINYVTCYVSLMDELIDMEEDVGVLIESEILTNYLGSDAEVAKLFNALCKGVTMSRTDAFEELKRQVPQQYNSKFKVWSADFLKKYTSTPWTILALIGAVLALLLSVVQTVFSIIAVYK